MDVDRLRAATRTQHEAVEALLPLMSPALTREQYAQVLTCFQAAVSGWEDWAMRHEPPHLSGLIAERRRAHLIQADLQSLGKQSTATSFTPFGDMLPAAATDNPFPEATFLGAMYVVEGSTLGGQHIARHLEARFGFEPGHGDAYFCGYGEQTAAKWRSFKELLLELPDEQTDAVIAAAKAMFAYFSHALQPCAPTVATGLHIA